MKNRTLAVILAISGILLGIAVYRTIAAKAQENEEITPFQSTETNDNPVKINRPIQEDDEDLFGLDDE